MIDAILSILSLYGVYHLYLWIINRIDEEDRRENEILRRSEDEHDISDWGV